MARFPEWDFSKLIYKGVGVSFHEIGFTHFMYEDTPLSLAHECSWVDGVDDYYNWSVGHVSCGKN
jgi:hypothetical protein